MPFFFVRDLARGLGLALIFATAFGGTCWLVGVLLPFPAVPEVTSKRAHLAEHGADYDALFIGSSRVDMQIMPTVFDRRMAELGFPIRTYNAGVSAMTPPEDAFFFDEIGRLPHPRLRWVFIEVGQVVSEAEHWFPESGRFVYWHDAPRLRLIWQCFLAEWQRNEKRLRGKKQKKWPWFQRLETRHRPLRAWLVHVSALFQNYSNLGQGAALASLFLPAGTEAPYFEKLDPALSDGSPTLGTMPEARRAEYALAYAERLVTPQTPTWSNPASSAALRLIVNKVIAIGATPVLLVSPTPRRTQFMPPADLQRSCIVLNFSDVRAFPDLYRPEHRLDVEHLNDLGAPIYSRLLAEQFAAAMRTAAPR